LLCASQPVSRHAPPPSYSSTTAQDGLSAGPIDTTHSAGTANAPAAVFATLADALAATSRDPSALERPASRARLEMFLAEVGAGYVIATRDPAFQNGRPNGRPDWVSGFPPTDPWQELAELRVPTLAIRANRSQAFDEASLRRLRDEFPGVTVVEVDSGHDVAATASVALVSAVQTFLETTLQPPREKEQT
jgi:pimeloyl-ACP methyl ester carboxylesterase